MLLARLVSMGRDTLEKIISKKCKMGVAEFVKVCIVLFPDEQGRRKS